MIDTIAFYHYVTNVYTYECMYVNIFKYLNTVDLNENQTGDFRFLKEIQ